MQDLLLTELKEIKSQHQALCSLIADLLTELKSWKPAKNEKSQPHQTHKENFMQSMMREQSAQNHKRQAIPYISGSPRSGVSEKNGAAAKLQLAAASPAVVMLLQQADELFDAMPAEWQEIVNSLRNFKKLSDKQIKYLSDIVSKTRLTTLEQASSQLANA